MKAKYLFILVVLLCVGCSKNKPTENNNQIISKKLDSSVILPQIIDLSLRDAEERLRENNLVVKEKIFENVPNSPPSNFILRVELNGKEINPGSKIPKWSELTLIVQMNEEQIKSK